MNIADMLLMEDKMVLNTFVRAAAKRERRFESDGDNYLWIHGTQPYAVVAHIDTVSSIKSKVGRVIQNDGGILRAYKINSKNNQIPTILGADDRAGCFILYSMLCNPEISPHILLTNYEECGGQGVKKFLASGIEYKHIKLFIEFDRRGCDYWVEYTDNPKCVEDFTDKFCLKKYGRGSFSDIAFISRESKIPAINIACGYYNEHSERECLDIAAMKLALYKSTEMLRMLKEKPVDFGIIKEPEVIQYTGYQYNKGLGVHTAKIEHKIAPTIPRTPQGYAYFNQQMNKKFTELCDDCREPLIDCVCGSIMSANQLALELQGEEPHPFAIVEQKHSRLLQPTNFLQSNHKQIRERLENSAESRKAQKKKMREDAKKKGVLKV